MITMYGDSGKKSCNEDNKPRLDDPSTYSTVPLGDEAF